MSRQAARSRGHFRLQSAAAGRSPAVFLPGRRIRILPTRYGFIFLVMLAALLLGAVNHNNNLGYLLTFLLAGMALVSIFHTRRHLLRPTLAAVRSRPVFAGQQALFDITVQTSGAAAPAISFRFPPGEPTTVNLTGGGMQTVRVSLPAAERGLLRPGTLAVATAYPLGLFQGKCSLPLHASCLVYPRPLPGPLVSVPGYEDKESEGDAGGSGVDDFAGLEPYQPGDPLQHLSWKTYSRGRGLHTKKFEGLRGKSIVFDPAALPGPDFEWKLSRICFMILKAEAMRTPYGLQLDRRMIKPALGDKHKRQCLRELALAGRRGG